MELWDPFPSPTSPLLPSCFACQLKAVFHPLYHTPKTLHTQTLCATSPPILF